MNRQPAIPKRLGLLTAVALAALLAGCAAPGGASNATPQLELPATNAAVPAVAADWWKAYGDPQLDALVDEALRNNRDLARAMARIDESRASLRLTQADRYPSINAGLSGARARASETGPAIAGGIGNDFRATLNVAYEVDLWGRVANAGKAAREELLATEYARETLRTALAAQVVQSYAALQSLDAQVDLFTRAVVAQRDSVKLQKVRFDAGDLSELDLRQLEAELAANEGQLPKLERARGEAERALGFVLGRSPRALLEQNLPRSATAAAVNTSIPEGLPSDLLQRRPDVQAAEARLRAAGARVDAARAAYFPSISLTGSWGRESSDFSKLMDAPSLIWSVMASLTQPIWNGGRIDAQNDLAKARRVQAELDYRDSVAAAFREARDALGAYAEAQASLQILQQRVQALQRAEQLTRVRFDGGVASRLDLIEAERFALTAQASQADARRALAAAQADVFRVLGGGWQPQATNQQQAAHQPGTTS
ncbi:efflux transporter outer membrane subunit [Methylibium rhizosphaerae]|uniref:efflux transporter outer membrane subunit n=1 Tax=Methylibium rhizosphaerae TaxID=2570323 RepID=UPI001128CB94|nr:efflux transporter outer membrane subunit [Methylibium rhizosphaerae]